MRVLVIPEDMTLRVGNRTITLKAGTRPYPDEVANTLGMDRYWEPEAEPAPAPPAPPAPAAKTPAAKSGADQ